MTYTLGGLNRFLDLYRRETNSYWIHPINYGQIPHILMVGIKHNGGDEDSYSFTEYGTGIALGSLIDELQDAALRSDLSSNWLPDDLDRFYYNVLDLFDLEDYWSAVLAVEIYFEAKLSRFLRARFSKTGLTEPEIERRFETEKGFPRSATDLIKIYVFGPAGISVSDESHSLAQIFNNWCVNARDLRNMVAHGKKFAVSRDQASLAIRTVNSFISQLIPYLS